MPGRFRGAAVATTMGIALVCAMAISAVAQTRCRVTDPTTTPLNIRSAPNGRIVGNVANDVLVSVHGTATDANGKPWIFVRHRESGEPLGWVLREFVSCF